MRRMDMYVVDQGASNWIIKLLRSRLAALEHILNKNDEWTIDFTNYCIKQRELVLKELLTKQLEYFNND